MEDSIRAQSSPSRPRVHLIDKLHNLYFLSLYPPTIEHKITTLTSILNMKIPQWPPPASWPPPSRSPNSETIKGSQHRSSWSGSAWAQQAQGSFLSLLSFSTGLDARPENSSFLRQLLTDLPESRFILWYYLYFKHIKNWILTIIKRPIVNGWSVCEVANQHMRVKNKRYCIWQRWHENKVSPKTWEGRKSADIYNLSLQALDSTSLLRSSVSHLLHV